MIWTVGHSTRTQDELWDILKSDRIELLVDVRSYPTSGYCPQWKHDAICDGLPDWLTYTWMSGLGGRRNPVKDSVNTAWRNASFRGYADYMQTTTFRDSLTALRRLAKQHRLAIMCSEAVWWRCHRSMIADALVAHDVDVMHLGVSADDRHKLRDFAVIGKNKRITYPGTETT